MRLRVNDAAAGAVARLIPTTAAPPTHDDLDAGFARCGLGAGDPGREDANHKPIGKVRRVKAVLTYATDNDPEAGGKLIEYLLARLRGGGAFRLESPNCLPADDVENLRDILRPEGFALGQDGTLAPVVFAELTGRDLTDALAAYVRRAREGDEDAALVTGTGKDLLEAVARHVLVERTGSYNEQMDFPGTLFHAFRQLDQTHLTGQEPGLRAHLADDGVDRLYQCLYLLALAVNDLRNQQGTGHGRPFPATITPTDARVATEAMGLVAGLLLDGL